MWHPVLFFNSFLLPLPENWIKFTYPEAFFVLVQGCAARNVHGFTQNDIFKMANQWEDAPSLYMKLDGKVFIDYYSLPPSVWHDQNTSRLTT